MSYTKELAFHNYTIEFEYIYSQENQGLILTFWKAFCGPNEIEIPCRVESEFIESKLQDWVREEWSFNGSNYLQDRVDYLGEKKYNLSEEK